MSRLARALARLARRAESAASGRGASPSAPIPRAGSSLARARERGTSPRFASARPWHSPRRASSSVAPPPDADASRLVEHDDDVDYARLAADRESSPASASSASSSSSAAAAALKGRDGRPPLLGTCGAIKALIRVATQVEVVL